MNNNDLVIRNDVFIIANCQVDSDGILRGVLTANARLIAAAPDLLEACKRIHNYFMGTGGDPLGVDQVVEKAIAKAEGRD
jgi:hypothetical protein